ncbi:MAG: flagellar filament capping protein FliD [Terriglobales bacterium]|jgi:flagellar hook-associated protein 2
MGISFNSANLLNGNGIDVNSVVSQIQAAQSGQMTVWKGDLTTLQTQATAINSISTDLSNLQSAMQTLADPFGALTALAATSSESAIVTATTLSGATAANYSVVVSALASAGTVYTDAVTNANTSILSSGQTTGDLNLQIGGNGGTAVDIPITKGSNDTLNTLAASIDTLSTKNKWGITASVLNDASGSRLAIYSTATGSAGELSINTNSQTIMTFEKPVGGTDAQVSVNGIPYLSTTNTMSGAIANVTLNLVSADPATPVEISVAPDTSAITTAINNFVASYNTVIGDINTQFTVNAATNTEGPLGSDTYLRQLQSSLEADMSYATTDSTSVSSGLTNLGSLGIVMNDDGTLTVNQTAVDTATDYSPSFPDVLASNPSGVLNFFQNSNLTGFANNFTNDLKNLTYPVTGVLNADLAENQSEQSELTTEIDNFQTQLAAQTIQLDQEFDQVNANLEGYPFLLQEITEMLGSMSSTGSTATPTTSTNTTPTSGNGVSSTSSTSSSS